MSEPLLLDHLAAVVPLLILDLERQGGVSDWHIEEAQRRRGPGMDHQDEAIFYKIEGLTGQKTHELCEMLAVLAFVPGGVKFGKLHFEGKKRES